MGQNIIANLDGLRPLVRDEDVALLGARDADEREGSAAPTRAPRPCWSSTWARPGEPGVREAAEQAARHVLNEGVESYWIHL